MKQYRIELARSTDLSNDRRMPLAVPLSFPRAEDTFDLDLASNSILPDTMIQDRLVGLYFVHFHPAVPVLHQERFIKAYTVQ